MEGDRDVCLAAGMDDYITKPVRLDVVEATLRQWYVADGPAEDVPVADVPVADVPVAVAPVAVAPAAGAGPGAIATALLAEAVPPQADAVDPERLAMLRGLDDGVGALLSELAVHFFDQAVSTRIGLTEALDARDGGTVSRHAHKLRGAAANIGATALEAVCADLERCGLDGRIEEATALVARFDDECGRVRIALDAQIAEPAP
jgi:hypothetical protein